VRVQKALVADVCPRQLSKREGGDVFYDVVQEEKRERKKRE